MARINLLPWREQLREERKKRFLTALAGVLVAAVGFILLTDQYISGAIDHQTARNAYIQKEIVQLDARIKEISELKARRKQLLERMKIIQDLQGNRPIIGRVFDQLARTLPDGVYFNQVKMVDKLISISGVAESNNRVSDLMRNLDASDWLHAPSLTEVKANVPGATGAAATPGSTDPANTFQLTVKQVQPAVEGVKP
jgi:type IV pilus assembly protein PilN